MSERFRTVLLFGTPGVGKGTQGKILGTIPGFYHCASGDIFRNIDAESELGRIFHDYSTRGALVPDEVTVRMWDQFMEDVGSRGDFDRATDLLLLDGIPRTTEQAKLLDPHIEVLKIVHLTCTDQETMVQRLRKRALEQNRHDDADENVIRHRWTVYERHTHPLLAHYKRSLIAKVDAMGTPAQVLRNVLDVLPNQ